MALILQIQGNWCDWLVRDHETVVIEKMLEKIRSQKITAGLAAHTIDSLITCEEKGNSARLLHEDHAPR